ncbi:alpha/beta-hydrolase [Mytilinidion resinicola]|uniref:Alpha/beta-hydrolase n=1 Tax=Mytilinidion resinicola TaxID=574789 RepID=A0A6A6Z7E0_9PEZI|nr:alpha/beta-hydrolase [Mytilinidion resinicola]KAF2816976.1 alpha/beta-hydrolase [Mytilinidion resinicola]
MPFFQPPNQENVSLFYTDDGARASTPLLLLHGYLCDSHDWSAQIPALLSAGHRVLALDLRGHGRSTTPPPPYSPHIFAADILALLSHLSIPSVVLIAHSMSTITASIVAVEHPHLVRALVLVHPIYAITGPALSALLEEMRADAARAPELAARFFAAGMYTPRTPAWVQTWNRRRALGADPEVVVGCMAGLVALEGMVTGRGEAARAYMRRRRAPRLVVSGVDTAMEWEREVGWGEGDEVREVREGAFLHVVEGDVVNGYIIEWLKKIL